jgi:hypothetical protein
VIVGHDLKMNVEMVSPERIDPDGEASGRSRGADAFRGEANERSELVNRTGIEPPVPQRSVNLIQPVLAAGEGDE